ncbi:MAG: isochorismatase family protein [Chloroflexota bacterium]|nr:isochorismatase family protein [Chloroflexota bacterium]
MASYRPTTALLVVDVQNDFASPDGSLWVRGGEEILAVLYGEIDTAVPGGALVAYTQDCHPASTPHFAKDGGAWPVHCVQGTWGAEFHPRLAVRGPVVRKGTGGEDGYSGFSVRDPTTGDRHATELDRLLRAHGVTRVVIGGLATDYCVRETALDARRLGYDVEVLSDAVRAVDLEAGDGDRALADLREAGVTVR